MVNKVTLVGRLTADAHKRVTRGGTELAHLEVETRERWRTESGNLHEHVEHHEVTVWSRPGQRIDAQIQLLVRGTLVYIEGRIQTAHRRLADGTEIDVKRIMMTRIRVLDANLSERERDEFSRVKL